MRSSAGRTVRDLVLDAVTRANERLQFRVTWQG